MSAPPTWADLEGPLREEVRRLLRERPEPVWDRPLFVLVEKILGKGEPVPEDWPVHGTTGYEYLNALNGLFVEVAQERPFNRIYGRWTGGSVPFSDLVFQKKFLILQVALSSELHVLAHQLDRIALRNRYSRDFTLNSLRHALRAVIACFPVYRSYIAGGDVVPRDRFYVEAAVARAKRKNPAISASLFDFVRDVVLLKGWEAMPERERFARRHFVGKFQQVTSPVMAKGLEDTAFYVYNRLVSLNEVGGDPDQFGLSPTLFHLHNQDRIDHWPHALSATSTHDTKRSEDVRARLNVLSELPQEWQRCLSLWKRLNRRFHIQIEDQIAPDANDEYLLYQTLIGAWPLEPYTAEEFATFVERIRAYMHKAIHEAKVHSSWINPNPPYDEAVRRFVGEILDEKNNAKFVEDLRGFVRRVSHIGLFNSLAQTLLKIVSPGTPDIYQGTELWDFSLVDPDNRRPVDYERRRKLLDELRARPPSPELAEELTRTKEDGRTKLYVTYQALHCRRDHPGLFSTGEYQAADAVGSRRENVVGLIRRWENRCAVAVVPRLIAPLIGQSGAVPLGPDVWRETFLLLPGEQAGRRFQNVYTAELLTTTQREGHVGLPLAEVFAHFPVALFVARD